MDEHISVGKLEEERKRKREPEGYELLLDRMNTLTNEFKLQESNVHFVIAAERERLHAELHAEKERMCAELQEGKARVLAELNRKQSELTDEKDRKWSELEKEKDRLVAEVHAEKKRVLAELSSEKARLLAELKVAVQREEASLAMKVAEYAHLWASAKSQEVEDAHKRLDAALRLNADLSAELNALRALCRSGELGV